MVFRDFVEQDKITTSIHENIKSLNSILKQMKMGYLSIFAGAGLSVSSGYVDWKKLMLPVCELMRLDNSGDLTEIAQFYKNKYGRQGLNDIIFEEFSKIPKNNANIEILSRLPIKNYWTTNYDDVIETELRKRGLNIHKLEFQDSFKYHVNKGDVNVYKMHGDKEHPDNIVITKEDYQQYDKKRGLFSKLLSVDFVRNTFLFIGFSFNDPNLERILSVAKGSVDSSVIANHYCFMRKVQPYDYLDEDYKITQEGKLKYIKDSSYQKLKIESLKDNYNIHTILVDDYEQITYMLQYLYDMYTINNVFVSGGINPNDLTNYGEFNKKCDSDNKLSKAQEFLTLLGESLIKNNYIIYTGFGAGVGNYILSGVLSWNNNRLQMIDEINSKIHIYNMINLSEKQKEKVRSRIVQSCANTIIVFGYNPNTNQGDTSSGVYKEYELARVNNNFIIPVPATGQEASKIYEKMEPMLKDYNQYQILKDVNSSNKSLVDNIISLLNDNKMRTENKLKNRLSNSIATFGIKVFISYHYAKDQNIAKTIVNIVNNDGFNQFRIVEEKGKVISPNEVEKWVDKQLDNSKITILLISRKTFSRNFVKYELRKSVEKNKIIIPIVIDDKANNFKEKDYNKIKGLLEKKGIIDVVIRRWYKQKGEDNIISWLYEASKHIKTLEYT